MSYSKKISITKTTELVSFCLYIVSKDFEESKISVGPRLCLKVSLSLRKKSRHRHVGLQVWQLITTSQFDDWRHIVHHWKGNFHSFETIFPQNQKSIYAPAKYDLFNCSFIKPKQRYLADFGPRYHNK